MNDDDFQQLFFAALSGQFPSQRQMITAICEELHIGTAAAYRRANGSTALTANEMWQLARRFQLSLPRTDNDIPFRFNQFDRQIRGPEDYLMEMEEYLNMIDAWPNKTLYYATPDLPFFYEMCAPHLLRYKMYVYGLSSWGIRDWEGQAFRPELIDPAIVKRADEIGRYAYRTESIELWTTSVLDATLSQVEYMVLADRFADPKYSLLILDDLEELVAHIEKMAVSEKKFSPGARPENSQVSYALHYNELLYASTTILIDSPGASLLFLSFITPNYLRTADPALATAVKNWLLELTGAATLLGKNARKYRRWYFNGLRRRIDVSRNQIEILIDEMK